MITINWKLALNSKSEEIFFRSLSPIAKLGKSISAVAGAISSTGAFKLNTSMYPTIMLMIMFSSSDPELK